MYALGVQVNMENRTYDRTCDTCGESTNSNISSFMLGALGANTAASKQAALITAEHLRLVIYESESGSV